MFVCINSYSGNVEVNEIGLSFNISYIRVFLVQLFYKYTAQPELYNCNYSDDDRNSR